MVEAVNDSATAFRVSTIIGSIWIAEGGLTSSDTFNDGTKRAHTASMLRSVFLLVHQFAGCQPTLVPALVDALLDIQTSLTCALSSYLLGLLVKAHASVLEAVRPRLDGMYNRFREVSMYFLGVFFFFLYLCRPPLPLFFPTDTILIVLRKNIIIIIRKKKKRTLLFLRLLLFF